MSRIKYSKFKSKLIKNINFNSFDANQMLFLNNVFVQQSALIDDKSANKFKNQLLMPIKLTKAAEYGLIVLGAFMLICTAALFIKQKVSSKVSCTCNIHVRDWMGFFKFKLLFR